jgi:preprotein translocase subunit SecA
LQRIARPSESAGVGAVLAAWVDNTDVNWRKRARALADYLRTGHILENVAVHSALLAQADVLEAEMRTLSNAALRERAAALHQDIAAGLPLYTASPRLFALVREIADRELGLRPFDVQLLAGFALAAGKLVQMQTGEGKTLAAVAPAALHAMRGGGVHVLTFNDYLAGRDATWMRPIYAALGLSVGVVQEGMPIAERRAAYRADITYVTAKEAGFDYLRDGLAYDPAEITHRPLNVALIAQLRRGAHYGLDAERRSAHLTEAGIDQLEAQLACGNLYDLDNLTLLTEVNAALSAMLLRRDADYIVRNGRVELVDEFTGRVADKRQWPDGLQAAIEAREGVRRSARGRVLGQITLQHFLLQYPTLCGMTATAATAADELLAVYGLEVQLASPNRPCIRADLPDLAFTHAEAKLAALCDEVARLHASGQPVLVGTLTVAESEA